MSKKLAGFSPARKFSWNSEAESEGIWREAFGGTARLKVARFNNPAHTAMRSEHEEVLKNRESEEGLRVLALIRNQAMASHILKGWEGIQDEDGKELPFSVEAAEDLMTRFEEFGNTVFQLSLDAEQYRKYREDDAVKNCPSACAGKRPTGRPCPACAA